MFNNPNGTFQHAKLAAYVVPLPQSQDERVWLAIGVPLLALTVGTGYVWHLRRRRTQSARRS